jgi:ribokinase
MSRVIVVGSANIDLITQVAHLPVQGETVMGSDVAQRPGGKGANQAVASRRLGADTTMFAAVGTDAFGDAVLAALQAEGVRAEHVTRYPEAVTGIAMVIVSDTGENSIVVAPGANFLLDADAVADLGTVCGPGDVLVLQLEVPLDTCLAAARTARRRGAHVLLNAAPLPTVGDPILSDLLHHVDVLIVNEAEAAALAGTDQSHGAGWESVAARLRELGPATVVITLGARGAVAASIDGAHTQTPFSADVVDTTGAGDAFCGAFASAYAEGRDLPDALRRGCAAGALATTALGAQSALPTESDLTRLLSDVT